MRPTSWLLKKWTPPWEAFGSILTGNSSKDVIERYRELVAADASGCVRAQGK